MSFKISGEQKGIAYSNPEITPSFLLHFNLKLEQKKTNMLTRQQISIG